MRLSSKSFKTLIEENKQNQLIKIKYDELKNPLEIENFSGTTKIAIEQDFYASIYLSNMIELARKDSNNIIKSEREHKTI